ncbi:MAG TPA: TetR/AcrR family transcriptional regulator [Nitriliruptorales bacterium]
MPLIATDDRIRETALRLFAEKGFAATGIREIAEQVGVMSASLYHHIGSKEDLLFRIAIDANRQLLRAARDAFCEVSRPEERLVTLVRLHVAAHAHHQLEALVVDNEMRALSDAKRDEVVAVRDAYERMWQDAIADGVRDGVFTVDDERAARLALLEMCTGVAHWFSPSGEQTAEQIGAHFADMALGLVRARRGRYLRVDDVAQPTYERIQELLRRGPTSLADGDPGPRARVG